MKTITIMPDYGMSPYAWIKEATDTSEYVGVNCGGYGCKPEEFSMSQSLHDQFVQWSSDFEKNADKPGFDWKAFHEKGVDLSCTLKLSVGSNFKVMYATPHEDPDCLKSPVFEVK